MTNATVTLNPDDFMQVYSGIAGRCCCGCAGKHTHSEKVRGRGKEIRGYELDDDEVSERGFKMLLRKVERFINEGMSYDACPQYISVVNGHRLYVAYRTPEARAKEEAK